MDLAYDYDARRWIEGPEATALLKRQHDELVTLLRSPQGQAYLDATRRRGEPRRMVADVLREME